MVVVLLYRIVQTLIFELLLSLLCTILCVLCFLLCMFVPYVTILLPVGEMKDDDDDED